MKALLIAVSAVALSAGVALARDVNSTAPDNDELGHQTLQSQSVAGDYVFRPASAHNVQYPSHVIVKDDPATQPD